MKYYIIAFTKDLWWVLNAFTKFVIYLCKLSFYIIRDLIKKIRRKAFEILFPEYFDIIFALDEAIQRNYDGKLSFDKASEKQIYIMGNITVENGPVIDINQSKNIKFASLKTKLNSLNR